MTSTCSPEWWAMISSIRRFFSGVQAASRYLSSGSAIA